MNFAWAPYAAGLLFGLVLVLTSSPAKAVGRSAREMFTPAPGKHDVDEVSEPTRGVYGCTCADCRWLWENRPSALVAVEGFSPLDLNPLKNRLLEKAASLRTYDHGLSPHVYQSEKKLW
jgi:hypothetical protein